MNRFLAVLLLQFSSLAGFSSVVQAVESRVLKAERPSYKDKASGITVSVEEGDATVIAKNKDGRVVWWDRPVPPTVPRKAKRTITHLGPVSQGYGKDKACVLIVFSDKSFGVIELATGKFIYLGSD